MTGTLGDGEANGGCSLTAAGSVVGMSLLESSTGHLTNIPHRALPTADHTRPIDDQDRGALREEAARATVLSFRFLNPPPEPPRRWWPPVPAPGWRLDKPLGRSKCPCEQRAAQVHLELPEARAAEPPSHLRGAALSCTLLSFYGVSGGYRPCHSRTDPRGLTCQSMASWPLWPQMTLGRRARYRETLGNVRPNASFRTRNPAKKRLPALRVSWLGGSGPHRGHPARSVHPFDKEEEQVLCDTRSGGSSRDAPSLRCAQSVGSCDAEGALS